MSRMSRVAAHRAMIARSVAQVLVVPWSVARGTRGAGSGSVRDARPHFLPRCRIPLRGRTFAQGEGTAPPCAVALGCQATRQSKHALRAQPEGRLALRAVCRVAARCHRITMAASPRRSAEALHEGPAVAGSGRVGEHKLAPHFTALQWIASLANFAGAALREPSHPAKPSARSCGTYLEVP